MTNHQMKRIPKVLLGLLLIRLLFSITNPPKIDEGKRNRNRNKSPQTNGSFLKVATPTISCLDSVTFADGRIDYRYPCRKFSELATEKNTSHLLIVGVLSHSPTPRAYIRETYACNRSNVLFVVGGPWNDTLQAEQEKYEDLIWVDRPESYRGIVFKVQTLFSAVYLHIPNCEAVLKTDTDVYVRLRMVEQVTFGKNLYNDYWGKCHGNSPVVREPGHQWYIPKELYEPDTYPKYATGSGYIISRRLLECIVTNTTKQFKALPTEDTNTGIHVERCTGGAVQCENHKGVKYAPELQVDFKRRNYLMQHNVKDRETMWELHRRSCCLPGKAFPESCSSAVMERCSGGS